MSALPSNFAVSPTGEQIPIVDASETGFSALTAEDFLRLLIVQLQNQDPTEPTSNEELLGQLSQMQSLQSNLDLSETLENLTSAQLSSAFTSSAGALIGKQIEATDENGEPVSGIAERAILREGKTYIGVGDIEVPIENITLIQEPTAE